MRPGVTAPRLSVQVVTWNSADVVDACLASLHAQTSPAMEAIVVDNASTDGSAEVAEKWFARGLSGTLRRESGNTGFCAAQNRALEISSGDWVLFLNPDAELPPDFVERALSVVDALPPDVGTVAPLILLPDGCPFSGRCVYERSECRDRWPAHELISEGHGVNCWIPRAEREETRAALPHFQVEVS